MKTSILVLMGLLVMTSVSDAKPRHHQPKVYSVKGTFGVDYGKSPAKTFWQREYGKPEGIQTTYQPDL